MKEFKQKTDADLRKLIADKSEELRNIRFGGAGAKVKNVKAGKTIKKDIARIHTELSMRKVEAKKTK